MQPKQEGLRTCGRTAVCLTFCMLLPAVAPAQPPDGPSADAPPATQPAGMPSIIRELPDYTGNLTHRRYLTGEWGGIRNELADSGILFELSMSQILQGNAHGGKNANNAFRYSGSADYTLKLDTARMRLWPGGLITLRGETQFGQSINRKVGAIDSPNMDALLPIADDPGITTLSEFNITQALSEKLVLVAGKLDPMSGDTNVFAHDEKTQFLNSAFRANPLLFPAAPYTTMGAGAIFLPTEWLTITTFVMDNDPKGAVTSTGFNTAFHGRNWLSVTQEYEFTWKPFSLPGHQRFGWFYTTRDFLLLDQDPRLRLPMTPGMRLLRPRLGLIPPPLRALGRAARLTRNLGDLDWTSDGWGVYYNFDQYLYTRPENPTEGFGLFGRFGWSDGESNAIERFYSLGLGGRGLIARRSGDTYGVGYFLANPSDDLPDILSLSDEQGVELFYNIKVMPWLHITPDLQIIVRPGAGFQDRDVAIVYGLRVQTTF